MTGSLSLLLSAVAVSSMWSEVPASENHCSHLDCTYRLIERIVAFEHKNAEMEKKLMVVERKNEELEILVNDELKQPNLVQTMNWTKSATAFTATIVSSPRTVPSSGRIIFDTIITNANNDYNPADGIFRAPVQGRYYFSVTIRKQEKGFIHPSLKKNGDVVANLASGDRTYWDGSGSMSVVLDLNLGDEVRVDGEPNQQIEGARRCLFTGYLLYPV